MDVHLTPAQEQRLQTIAAETHRTLDELAQEAVGGYLKHIENLTAAVRDGDESAERDGWLTNEEVFKRLNERLLKTV